MLTGKWSREFERLEESGFFFSACFTYEVLEPKGEVGLPKNMP